jgi:hypothetical protein
MPVHDLESIFYVLLYFCAKYTGPGTTKAGGDVEKWFEPQELRILALLKADQLDHIRKFTKSFSPYFEDFASCIEELWEILFPLDVGARGTWRDMFHSNATHAAMLVVLERKYAELPDVDPEVAPMSVSRSPSSSRKPSSSGIPPSSRQSPRRPSLALRPPSSRMPSLSRPSSSQPSSSQKSLPSPQLSASPSSRPPVRGRKRQAHDDISSQSHDSGFHSMHGSEGNGTSNTSQVKRLRSSDKGKKR